MEHNPFETIEKKLSKIEMMIKSLKPEEDKKNRFAQLDEFALYSGLSKHTIYSRLSRKDGEKIPGAFKAGPKMWLIDLDEWDNYLIQKKAEFQAA